MPDRRATVPTVSPAKMSRPRLVRAEPLMAERNGKKPKLLAVDLLLVENLRQREFLA
jgi:hypothetical protein